nr:hypothetical protein [Xanthomonas oryzae]
MRIPAKAAFRAPLHNAALGALGGCCGTQSALVVSMLATVAALSSRICSASYRRMQSSVLLRSTAHSSRMRCMR